MKSARPTNIAKSTRYAERIRRFDVSVWNARSSDRGWNRSSQSIERGSSSSVVGIIGQRVTSLHDSPPSTRFGLIALRHRTPRAWHACTIESQSLARGCQCEASSRTQVRGFFFFSSLGTPDGHTDRQPQWSIEGRSVNHASAVLCRHPQHRRWCVSTFDRRRRAPVLTLTTHDLLQVSLTSTRACRSSAGPCSPAT